jgi:hypothetical protein
MATGPMQYGSDNNAGDSETILRSTVVVGPTLEVRSDLATDNSPTFRAQGNDIGVQGRGGEKRSSRGVIGSTHTGAGVGVVGYSATGIGVRGTSRTGTAIIGECDAGIAIDGRTDTGSAGVYGHVPDSHDGSGVLGEANDGIGVWGKSRRRLAGYFSGQVEVTGFLVKSGGGFRIDHPHDPENKYLSHSFVESPEALNVYSGTVTTDADGGATVTLPGYFEDLNEDFRYQLTVIGQFAQAIVAEEISGNEFTIRTDRPIVRVSWQVTGVRKDPFAALHRITVEEDKPQEERGTYLHPEVYGRSGANSVDQVRERALTAQRLELPEPVPDDLVPGEEGGRQ